MQVEAWIAPLDPMEPRRCLGAVLAGETAKVVERSPREGDGPRAVSAGHSGGGLVDPCHEAVKRGCSEGRFHPLRRQPLRSEFPVGPVEAGADKLGEFATPQLPQGTSVPAAAA